MMSHETTASPSPGAVAPAGGPSAASAFRDAVESRLANLLVIAPPGCGKTELLAQRARHLAVALEPQQRILALTFSNKAKANLANRLRGSVGVDLVRRHVTVRNFHGFATELIRSHGGTLGIDTDFQNPNRRTFENAVRPHLEGLSENGAAALKSQIETELRTAKQHPYRDAQVVAWLEQNAGAEAVAIEQERQTAGLLHYDDLLRHAQRLLRVPEIARLYQAHFAAVLVDEFQDLSPQQLDLALRSSVQSRTFVGDPLQGIYSWAGAQPARVEKQLRRLCGQPSGLGVSYRSSPNVLAVLNAVAVDLGGHALAAKDDNAWFEGGITSGFVASSGADEATSIVRMCRGILKSRPEATIGVISRMGWRRTHVDAAFTEADDVPHLRWDLATDDPHIVDLLRSAADRIGSGTASDIDRDSLRAELLAAVDAADVDTDADVEDALDLLGEWAAHVGSLRGALELLTEPNTDKPIAPGVHLLNAHIGKGQQFDWVLIPGFEQGHLPSFLAKSPAERLEEKRILLVILSRARHGVVISRSKTLISKRGIEYSPDPSAWTTLVRGAFSATSSELRDHIARLPSAADSGPTRT